jgi:hypothetical protein
MVVCQVMNRYYIREWRRYRGFDSIAKFAKELADAPTPVPESTLKKIESGQTRQPHSSTLDAIAEALHTKSSDLRQLPPTDGQSRPTTRRRSRTTEPNQLAGLPYLNSLPWPDAPDIDDEERQRRTEKRDQVTRLWQTVFDMRERPNESVVDAPHDEFPLRQRQVALAAMEQGWWTVIESLLFVGVVSRVASGLNGCAEDRVAYDGVLKRLQQLVSDACRVGELVYLLEEFGGGAVGMQLLREADEGDVRAYERAVEAWEAIYAPVIRRWTGQSPSWDEDGKRLLFVEAAPLFRVFESLFGARSASVAAAAEAATVEEASGEHD